MIKLIASDLDDTLLNSSSAISLKNKRTIEEARRRGILFVIATGRMFAAAAPFARELGLSADDPLICYNGALIKKLSGATIYEQTLPVEVACTVAEYGQKRKWTLNAFYQDQLYVARLDDRIREYSAFTGVGVQEVGDLVDFIQDGPKHLSKMLFISDPAETPARIEKLKKVVGSRAQIAQSRSKFIEVTGPTAHKGQALAWLVNSLGFEKEEVLAIGDSTNDLSMLQMAGIGVAVDNAVDTVRNAVLHRTVSNDEDGVACAIEKYALI